MPTRTSIGLAVTGLAMLAVQFVIADAGAAKDTWRWPWDVVQEAGVPLAQRAMHVLWALTALWALSLAFTRAARVRAAVLAALGAAVAVVSLRGAGRFTLESPVPAEWLGLVVLGGGLLIAREPSTRGLGRLAAGLGALIVVWVLATRFPATGGPNQLQQYGLDVLAAFDDPSALWRSLLPQTLRLLGCLVGVSALFGATARGCLWTGFFAVLLGLLAPGVIQAVEADSFEFALLLPVGVASALWALGAFTAQDLARGKA